MADSFGISNLMEYLSKMDLKIAQVDREREVIELAFHGNYGQWRMIVGFQQSGDVRKLMLVVPQFATVTDKKRLEYLEAFMAVNYRIAMGKFGIDLDDGEVRLEETIPMADNTLTYSQFQLIFGAMMQTVAIYHKLPAKILQEDLSTSSIAELIRACEQEFFQEEGEAATPATNPSLIPSSVQQTEEPEHEETELNVHDVLEEVSRLLRQGRD